MISRTPMAAAHTDLQGLARLRAQAAKQTPEAKREVAKQFEALFLQTMLKTMRSAGGNDGLLEGAQADLYRDMHDQQLAQHLAHTSSIGFADVILRQLGDEQSQTINPDLKRSPIAVAAPSKASAPGPLSGTNFANRLWGTAARASLPPLIASPKAQPAAQVQAKQTPAPTERLLEPTAHIPDPKRWHGPRTFIKDLWPAAVDAAREIGTQPEAVLAVAALETGWGRHVARRSDGQSSHNLFGIKANRGWRSGKVVASTLEFENGVMVRRNEPFRSYPSPADSIADFADFLKRNPRYKNVLNNARDPIQFARGLQKAGYATDPNYAKKLAGIINGKAMRLAVAEASRQSAPAVDHVARVAENSPTSTPARTRRPGPDGFVQDIWPQAITAARKLGTRPEVIVAVAALDTGWGRHTRSAADMIDNFVDSVSTKPQYARVREHADDSVAFVRGLQEAGHVSDPNYARKLESILRGRTLKTALADLKDPGRLPIA